MPRTTLILTACAIWCAGCAPGDFAAWPHVGKSAPQDETPSEPQLVYHTLEPAMAPLARPDQDRYVRVTVALGMLPEARTKMREQIDARWLDLREELIRCLSRRTLEELSGSEGIVRLQQDIARRIDEVLGDGGVRKVVFTEYAVR